MVGASVAPAPPRSKAKLTGRAAILFLVMLVLAVSYASSARAWLRQRNEISALTDQIANSKAAVAQLHQTNRRWHDRSYIEEQARCRFNWVMPGETGYTVLDSSGKPVTCTGSSTLSSPVSAAPASTHAWYQAAWDSVVQAGQDPATLAAAKQSGPHPAKRIGVTGRQDSRQPGQRHRTSSAGR